MTHGPNSPSPESGPEHPRWVRLTHWIATVSLLALAVSGFVILMAHPRLYWGKAGNDLMPALIEFPISPDFAQIGYADRTPFAGVPGNVMTASRTKEDFFNQNGWARSLHFLAGWALVFPGIVYLLTGLSGGHFRTHVVPRSADLAPPALRRDVADHLRFRIRPASGGPDYGPLQKLAYTMVIFLAAPLIVLTGLAMAPAVTAAVPWLLDIFGGHQSARTIHFLAFALLVGFVLVHLLMVAVSGFGRQIRGMTVGGRP